MHQVVFEVSVPGEDRWNAVLNNVENLRKALGAPDTRIAVVAHGKGIGLLKAEGNSLADRLHAIASGGVEFRACENTMRRENITPADLVGDAATVDSGVAEVVRRQEAGWSYIKAG